MFQGSGNIPPILAVVRELVERGHRVCVLAGPGLRPDGPVLAVSDAFCRDIAAAGATQFAFEWPEDPLARLTRRRGVFLGYVPRAFAANVFLARRFLAAQAWAQTMQQTLRRHRTQAVVADFYLVGALAAAQAARIPSVALVHHPHILPMPGVPPFGPGWKPASTPLGSLRDALGRWIVERVYRRDGLAALNEARAHFGLPSLRSPLEQYEAAERVLIMTSPAFDFRASTMPANARHVGMPSLRPEDAQWRPPWPRDDRRPLVLVSFSTAQQGQTRALQRTLVALGTLPVRALVTLGPAVSPERFEPQPNVLLERFVPHEAVLPHTSLVVSQCGHGTVMKALAHGVPLVCIPLVGDQPDVAARVVHAGAGIRLRRTASSRRIRDAVATVLADARYRECARHLAGRLGCETGAATAADEIESVVKGRRVANPGECRIQRRASPTSGSPT